jgi:2-succinyl-5-enolpyruvyl-6-hydroxy-3-cyclohexene-1-carboxylate synthase
VISAKKHIQQLASILKGRNIKHIIISPGSRNAPLALTFTGADFFHCLNVVDERCAAFFALGMAQELRQPVVLLCTSGTAALNYGPAIAEAYYQHVPLIVLTADRPSQWIDQGENQTIRQHGIFKNYVQKYITLPEKADTPEECWLTQRMIHEALHAALSPSPGPVHINIPLHEPLYETEDLPLPETKEIQLADNSPIIQDHTFNALAAIWNASSKKMIIAGQQHQHPKLSAIVEKLCRESGAVLLAESLANMYMPAGIYGIDNILAYLSQDEKKDLQPELLITFGGRLVSKELKTFLRANQPTHHWHIAITGQHTDTYQALTAVLPVNPSLFFHQLLTANKKCNQAFSMCWKEKEKQTFQLQKNFLAKISFSDLYIIQQILEFVPNHSVLHLGNSSAVRYVQLFKPTKTIQYHGNRGVSGIEGSMSTASGFAFTSAQLNTLIIGDLSFLYDSNALWNKHLPDNLRIIVINNQGGNMFGLIEGPDKVPAFKEHFMAAHAWQAKGLARAFHINYLRAKNKEQLAHSLSQLYDPKHTTTTILEVFSHPQINAKVYRAYFKHCKSG